MGTDIHIRVERRNERGQWEVVKPGPQPSPWDDDKFIEDWPTPRNYRFFALVANVRNGYGFAGVPTHNPIVPISEPRGLPADMASAVDADDQFEEYEDADAAGLANLGDHSYTWLLLSELQEGLRRPLEIEECGVVSIPTLAKLERPTDTPDNWSGGVSGPSVTFLPFDLAWAMSRHPDVVALCRTVWDRPQRPLGLSDVSEETPETSIARRLGLAEPAMQQPLHPIQIYTRMRWRRGIADTIDECYRRLVFEEWPKLGDPDNVRIIMGFDS